MPETTREIFARRLRKYRQYLGYTQIQMASRLGVVKSTLLGWEKLDGRGQPTWEQLHEMCSWSGVEPIYFFMSDEFGSDYLDTAEHLKALPTELRESLMTVIRHAVRTSYRKL